MVRYAADLGVPVLLHHGFLIDFNSLWHRSGVVQQLATDGLEVVRIIEHFLREAGDAHAFGHGTVLLLAEALADLPATSAASSAHLTFPACDTAAFAGIRRMEELCQCLPGRRSVSHV